MKIERKESFSPITITLETEAEAISMWAALNTSVSAKRATLPFCCQHLNVNDVDLWTEFDEVYPLVKIYDTSNK